MSRLIPSSIVAGIEENESVRCGWCISWTEVQACRWYSWTVLSKHEMYSKQSQRLWWLIKVPKPRREPRAHVFNVLRLNGGIRMWWLGCYCYCSSTNNSIRHVGKILDLSDISRVRSMNSTHTTGIKKTQPTEKSIVYHQCYSKATLLLPRQRDGKIRPGRHSRPSALASRLRPALNKR